MIKQKKINIKPVQKIIVVLFLLIMSTIFVVQASPKEYIFVDNSIENYSQLVSEIQIKSSSKIVYLDSQIDGVKQISKALNGQTNIGAIHIFSHGQSGSLQLGNSYLTLESMQSHHTSDLNTIQQTLSPTADLLIYGCDFAKGIRGKKASQLLSELTQSDVMASNDLTGNKSNGGDWSLEYSIGEIDSLPLVNSTQISWQGILQTNLAPAGTATQSSTSFGGIASRANDGNTNGRHRNQSVSHTARTANPSWMVELQENSFIDSIAVWNRTDCCRNRLRGFIVEVLDENSNIVHTYTHPGGTPGTTTTIPVPSGTIGKTVRVRLTRTDYLSLAEVQVFGTAIGETSTWTGDIPSGGWPAGSLGPHTNTGACHSENTLTSQVLNPDGVAITGGFPQASTENGGTLRVFSGAATAGEGINLQTTFGNPVEGVTFSVFDIDGTTTAVRDMVTVTASLGGVPVNVEIVRCPSANPPAAPGPNAPLCTGSGTTSAEVLAGTVVGGVTNQDFRADFRINGAVDSILIDFEQAAPNTAPGQFVTFSDFTYKCSIIGSSKQMTRRAGQADNLMPYLVDIDLTFENFGDTVLSNLTSLEDLTSVFNVAPYSSDNMTFNSITKLSGPTSFVVNDSFNGDSDQELMGNGSSLGVRQTAVIRVTVALNDYGSYTNQVNVEGSSPAGIERVDTSTDGTDPDGSDADDRPDEQVVSPLNTSLLPVSLSYLEATENGSELTIQWQTDIEFNHVGFQVFQGDEDSRLKLSEIISQSNVSQSIKNYSTTIKSYTNQPIWLAEYSTKGETKWYGPIEINSQIGEKLSESDTNIDWSSVAGNRIKDLKDERSTLQKNQTAASELAVYIEEDGVYSLDYNDLTQAGFNLNGLNPSHLKISLADKNVPIYIDGNRQSFDTTTSIHFYAQSIETLYLDERVYKLSIESSEQRQIVDSPVKPSTVIKNWYWHTDEYAPNLVYEASSPTPSPWRSALINSFDKEPFKKIEFPIDEIYLDTNQSVTLGFKVIGLSDWQTPPDEINTDPARCGAGFVNVYGGDPNDHCLYVNVNQQNLDEVSFDGISTQTNAYKLNESQISSGKVDVKIEVSGDTGYRWDQITLESVYLKYPRNLSAINNKLAFTIENSKAINNDLINVLAFEVNSNDGDFLGTRKNKASLMVTDLNSEDIVAYALEPFNSVRIKNTIVENSEGMYSVKFPAISENGRYWVSTKDALLKPRLGAWHQSRALNYQNINYLMISHSDFITEMQSLKDEYTDAGLSVELLDVNDIYAEYSESLVDPYAIKKYIQDVSKQSADLRFVLLVGSDNYDYKQYLSDQHISHIPSIYRQTDPTIKFAPVDSAYVDLNDDNVPDIAIGRFPVRTTEELDLLLQKQKKFKTQEGPQSSFFIADIADTTYSYKNISNELLAKTPSDWQSLTSYQDDFTTTDLTKSSIIDNFKQSPRLTSYIGHSGPRNWFTKTSIFNYNDVLNLDNELSASVIMQWGCWNSYYVEPKANTMAHRFLFNNEKGGVAVLGASAITSVESEQVFSNLIMDELYKPNQTIGESVIKAKAKLALTGDYPDVILGWNLLGDPALTVTQ